MRPGQLPSIRNDVMARLLARVRAGAPASEVCKQPDMPIYATLLAWRRRYPTFDEALAEARRVGLDRRRWGFDEARAEAFLARLRAGAGVREMLSARGAPISAALYRHWMRTQGAFQEEVNRLIADRRRRVRAMTPMAFDQALADAIVVAIGRGLEVRRVGPATGFPGSRVVWRWRREQPEFDLAIRVAVRVRRRRASLGRGPPPELLDEILDLVREGESLESLCKRPDMPSARTLRGWRKADPGLDRELEQARWERGDLLSDRIMEMTETPGMAWANRREARALMARLKRMDARAARSIRGEDR